MAKQETETSLSPATSLTGDAKTKGPSTEGKVWLVGAGPGDPDLLTVKAMKAIEKADIIFYDSLVSRDIRALFPSSVPALPQTLEDYAIKSPALILLGEVVELAQTLQPEAAEALLQSQSPQHRLSA